MNSVQIKAGEEHVVVDGLEAAQIVMTNNGTVFGSRNSDQVAETYRNDVRKAWPELARFDDTVLDLMRAGF